MVIFSTKLTKAKLITLALICCCIALVIIVAIPTSSNKTAAQTKYIAKTNDERVSFLEEYGWKISANPTDVVDVVIPTTFDSTYETYNTLQKTQGLDLETYKGDKATRYTYTVTNYQPEQNGPVQANLLVVNDKVIGGDITSTSLGGFMHGFEKPLENTIAEKQKSQDTGLTKQEVLDSLNEGSGK